jgi:hypothetical protein
MTALVYRVFIKRISDVYKYAGFISSLVLVGYFASAQDYPRKLDWQTKPKVFSLAEKTISQPTFTNAAHRDQYGLLPCYTERIPLSLAGEISVQLINPVYTRSSGLDNSSISFIKENAEAKAELSFYRKQPGAYISILPFRKNPVSGDIERLESFTLRLTVVPKPQKRSANGYANASVLASGDWYKIGVNNDGIFKVDYNFIKSTLGIDPASFNLSTLAIFGNGGGMVPDANSMARPDDLLENSTMVVDNNGNNKLDADDYLLFYGQMPDEWKLNASQGLFEHSKNLYTDKTYYFLTTTSGSGKRAQPNSFSGNPNKTITDFDDRFFHESDEENILRSGKEWLGDKMTAFNNTKSFSLNFPNLITSQPVKFKSYIAARTNPPGSSTSVTINGQTVLTQSDTGIPIGDYPNGYNPVINTISYTSSSDQLDIAYSFGVSSDPSGTASCYINYFELNLKRTLSFSGSAMSFRSISSIGPGNISQFILSNASSSTKIWDVTNVGDIQEMQTTLNGSQLSFIAATEELREFIAFNTNGSFTTPENIGRVANQNLHATGQPDMVILTYDDFESPSNALADFHRANENISVSVVKLSRIYNEFGSGKPDISAIRDFMRMLYDRAGSDTALMPRYLLLMGDGSYDPKGRIAESNNFIPTYQSYQSISVLSTYTSDDFFGLLDANEGGDITTAGQQIDIGIGRLPVESESEAWDVVNKIKNYKFPKMDASCNQINSNASWRNVLSFIADDLDEGGSIFESYSDGLANTTRSQNPAYNYDKIYLDAYKQLSTPAGPRYPEVNTAILNRINSGCLVMNWVGHGGETNLAHERIFNMADIIPLANKEKLPLFITATCEFGRYDLPDRTAGEWLVVNGKGGGIAAITTLRLVYQSANEAIASATFQNLFRPYEGRFPTLGEVVMNAKNAAGGSENTRKFTLLGDPALTLNYPRYNVITTQVDDKAITLDTLKALKQVTIKGELRDGNGSKLSSFNGVVYPLVYDKISEQKTLGNDEPSILNFSVYKNILYKGKASITNGDFSFTFIVPKDINYQYGYGRVSYYADNGAYTDAHGYTDSIIIGGSADSFKADGTGPKMDIYMNDEKFVFGGTTNADPMLLLKLSDETGINTVGNGIGHDLTAILDDNTQNKVVLNDYYESELDNYQKGVVKYPYAKLTDGKHTLKVKAWDIHNNSSEDYTEFVVASNAKLALNHVYNYPNPFTTRTQFMFEHNRSCDDLNVSVQIYTVSGRLVKSIVQQVHSEGYRVNDIEWNGLDDYGDPIGKGVYVYKLNVRDSDGNSAHKFEKLVVLR